MFKYEVLSDSGDAIASRNIVRSFANTALRLIGSEGRVATERDRVLKKISIDIDYPFVVQIGANDGYFDDPLYSFLKSNPNAKGILVEPQLKPFESLKDLYGDRDSLGLINAAVADSNGKLTLWKPQLSLPEDKFGDSLARINPVQIDSIMNRHPIRKIKGYSLASEEVEAVTLQRVFDESGIEPSIVDIFFCDTEGADIGIVNQLIDSGARPKLLQYEHILAIDDEVAMLNRRLLALGYDLNWSYRDILAIAQ